MGSESSNDAVTVRRLPEGVRVLGRVVGRCQLCERRKPEWVLGWTPEDDIQRRMGMSPGMYRDMIVVLCRSCAADRPKVVARLRMLAVLGLDAREGKGKADAL